MRHRRRFLSGMSVLLLVLSACGREPVEVEQPVEVVPAPLDFATDPRILRGVWVGEDAGVDLVLDLDASNPAADGYTITGTFRLGDEAAVPFSAHVSVPVVAGAASLESQTSQGCGAFLADIDGAQGQQWEACGFAPYGSPPRFSLRVIDWQQPGDPTGYNFVMTKLADETPLPIDDDASIRTDQERYTPEDFGDYITYTVEVSYTNTTGESVYLVPCSVTPPPPSYILEHFDGATWTYGYTGFCNSGPGTPPATEVEAGATFTDTLTLDAYRIPDRYPQLGTDFVTGVSRFVFDIAASVDGQGIATGDLLPLEQRVSNAFELRAP